MIYIDKNYYDESFKGTPIKAEQFERLAEIASSMIYDIAIQEITSEDALTDEVKKATCYQVELLSSQGGLDAILGFSAVGTNESLGDYSVSASTKPIPTKKGVPVSPLAITELKKAGLMCTWVYARRE